ncbi:type I DNA topoisomerase [Mycoplasma sp. 480]|uniref:type I DNA topoisomerase n=1 Tax=Mycoplasma sp. 480 TaxID=3440155 RepID=UPI003F50F706
MKKIVIVESPNKIKTIQKYLGTDYQVMACNGHIFEMKTSGIYGLGIDFENWEPIYKEDIKKKTIIKELKKAAKESDEVLIATDPDREGEAIGYNLVEALNIENKYQRIKYNEITEEAIKNAINKPLMIDQNLINSQKSRRMLDRIIGFRLSNLLTRKIQNARTNPSAGRVQSIALKLVVDREEEIKKFIPTKYHTIKATSDNNLEFSFFYKDKKEFENSEWISNFNINKIMSELKGDLVVKNIKITRKADAKITPLKQSTLFKKAGMSSKLVTKVLQELYEGIDESGGLISYPRTDSTRLSQTFINNAKSYVEKKYGKNYVSNTVKGISGDQDAHEAIRPTDWTLTPDMAKVKFNLNDSQYKIYNLIYNISLQAVMETPIREIVRYEFENNGHWFKLSSSKVVFDGYFSLIGRDKDDFIPDFKKGEIVKVNEYIPSENQTNPPSRYNEGSLIEAMDEIKVGRPSTFSSTVSVLKDRFYVESKNNALIPTDFGYAALEVLKDSVPKIIQEKYTSSIEEELNEIAEGKEDYKSFMNTFWNDFQEKMADSEQNNKKVQIPLEYTGENCPENEAPLIYRYNKKNGQRFIGCSSFPECKFMKPDPDAKKVFRRKK